jgi:hypothetical protein
MLQMFSFFSRLFKHTAPVKSKPFSHGDKEFDNLFHVFLDFQGVDISFYTHGFLSAYLPLQSLIFSEMIQTGILLN